MTGTFHCAGIESYCTPKGAKTKRIPLRGCQLDDAALRKMLTERRKAPSLFAYPAQSNLTGVQHSLGRSPPLRCLECLRHFHLFCNHQPGAPAASGRSCNGQPADSMPVDAELQQLNEEPLPISPPS